MSHRELSRLEIMEMIASKRIKQTEAAELLGISFRQLKRLYVKYKQYGVEGLISKQRGKPSNRQLAVGLENKAISLVKAHYSDFGPTLAHEKLYEVHNIRIGLSTLRTLMTKAGIWIPRKQRLKRSYQPRYRRDCYGELIQIDGSHHYWFEDRGPQCTLLVYIDDATSKLMMAKFFQKNRRLVISKQRKNIYYSTESQLVSIVISIVYFELSINLLKAKMVPRNLDVLLAI